MMSAESRAEIDTRDQGMTHWEKHANAFRMVMTGKGLASLDEMRRAAEDLARGFIKLVILSVKPRRRQLR